MASTNSAGKKTRTSGKKTTTKKSGSVQKKSPAVKAVKEQRSLNTKDGMNWTLKREVGYLCAFLVVLMLLLGLLLGNSFGSVGESIHSVCVGVFGIGAYLLLGGALVFILVNMRYPNHLMKKGKVICLGAMVLFLASIMHILNSASLTTIPEYYGQAKWYTGGVLGGILGNCLFGLFGKVGAVILLIGLLVLCSVIISERSFVSLLNLILHKTQNAAVTAKKRVGEKVKEYQENTQQMMEEAEAEQSDQAPMDAVESDSHYDPYNPYSEYSRKNPDNPYQREAEKLQRKASGSGDRKAAPENEQEYKKEDPRDHFGSYTGTYASEERKEILREVEWANRTYMNDPQQNPFLIEPTRPEAIPDENGLLPWVKDDETDHRSTRQAIRERQKENGNRKTAAQSRRGLRRNLQETTEDVQTDEKTVLNEDWKESGWFKTLPAGKRNLKSQKAASEAAEQIPGAKTAGLHQDIHQEKTDHSFRMDPEAQFSEGDPEFVQENEPYEEIQILEEPETEKRSVNRQRKSDFDDSEAEEARETKVSREPKAVEKAKPITRAEQEKVNQAIAENLANEEKIVKYEFPSIELLDKPKAQQQGSKDELYRKAAKLQEVLESFNVEATVTAVTQGPAVTRFELLPKTGVRVSRIAQLQNDIALNLAAPSIRIEAPIPGKSAVGIEIANEKASMVTLREILESREFQTFPSKLAFCLGKTIDGEIKVWDIGRMPHLLIAGATGSGKSVCINTMLMSLLFKADPKDVKLILIDPKVVELSVYNGIPHLLAPVVNDPMKAAGTLNWAVQEMTIRYKTFANWNVRDLKGYNELVKERALEGELLEPMPQIVIIIDELADLMMVAGKEVEKSIARLAQMARAAGMHLVIATQRPSVDVITGVIKANIPSRLAFAVSSGIDSRTILDSMGAEDLLGHGDMLFLPIGASKATRIQGAFVSDHEVERVVNAVKLKDTATASKQYNVDLQEQMAVSSAPASQEEEKDEFLEQAIIEVIKKQKCSSSYLQRMFRIGFNRAARLVDEMYERGIVGPDEGSKPRKVLMTMEEYEDLKKEEYPVDDTID